MRLWHKTGPAVLIVLGWMAPAWATADGPDFWRVWNVAPNDVLNVRVGPSPDYPSIHALTYDTRKISVIVCVPTTTRDQWFALSAGMQARLAAMPAWCLIEHGGIQRGWVNRRYLTEDGD